MLSEKATASRGWWKPGVSKCSRKSLRSCFSEEFYELLGIDGNPPLQGTVSA